jgi:hypothetical protein
MAFLCSIVHCFYSSESDIAVTYKRCGVSNSLQDLNYGSTGFIAPILTLATDSDICFAFSETRLVS